MGQRNSYRPGKLGHHFHRPVMQPINYEEMKPAELNLNRTLYLGVKNVSAKYLMVDLVAIKEGC